jgi:hypothetical protein
VDIGEQIVRRHLEERDREGANGPLLALMRSNGSLPKATALLREFIEETIPATVGRLLPGDAETRASLVAVQLLGLTYVRDILGVESLRRRSSDELAVLLGPLVTAVLTTPLPVPRTPGAPGLRPRHQPGPDGRPRRGRPK